MGRINNILRVARRDNHPIYFNAYPSWGRQTEQQGVVLAYPISWTPPAERTNNMGEFELIAREVASAE